MKNKNIHNNNINQNAVKLLSRHNFLVVQSNELSKSFGSLTTVEHKLLDFATSYIKKDSTGDELYTANILDIAKYLGWGKSGESYKRIVEGFDNLYKKDNLYIPIKDEGIMMTKLFSSISFFKSGQISFRFSQEVTPLLIDLKEKYYSFHLNELSVVKSKYTLILLKLWGANRMGESRLTRIKGSLEEWEQWFLGSNIVWPASRFKDKALNVAINGIDEKLNLTFKLENIKKGRKIIGFELFIFQN